MNPNDLLTASDAELPKMLGEVLQPRNSRHWFVKAYTAVNGGRYKRCRNCNNIVPASTPKGPCGTDPIPLDDWNVAMTWRDWAVKEYGLHPFLSAVREVVIYKLDIDPSRLYLACTLTSIQILTAAAVCKLNQKKASE